MNYLFTYTVIIKSESQETPNSLSSASHMRVVYLSLTFVSRIEINIQEKCIGSACNVIDLLT